MTKGTDSRRASTLPAVFLLLIFSPVSEAEITLDGTLGLGGSVTGPQYLIPAEVGEQVGGNLFHSFGVFNIDASESATFTGPNSIQNVLGRVTGGEGSTINGLLSSEIAGADLYLINPAGIIFGESAQLDVQGSFHASTADYVRLGENGRFAAARPNTSTLTVAQPSAFGFLTDRPEPVSITGSTLQVPIGETISLIGGDVAIRGSTLFAQRGRINIASVASAGEIDIIDNGLNLDAFARLGDIEISRASDVNVNGGRGGTVTIRGGDLIVDRGAVIQAATLAGGEGGGADIRIDGDLIIDNGIVGAGAGGTGPAGTIVIEAATIRVQNGGFIDSSSFGTGDAGNIRVEADSILIDASQVNPNGLLGGIFTRARTDSGNAGKIDIEAATVQVLGDGNTINGVIDSRTSGAGRGGGIRIVADELTLAKAAVITAGTAGSGRGGDITIQAGTAALRGGAQIDSSSFGSGAGGKVTLHATGDILISGRFKQTDFQSGLFSLADGTGPGGALTIITDSALVMNEGRILTRTLGDADAGTLMINAHDLTLTNGAQIFSGIGNPLQPGSQTGVGRGGDLDVTVADTLTISGTGFGGFQSGLFTNAQVGRGNAGNLSVSATRINVSDGGVISSISSGNSDGDAGNININVEDIAQLSNGSIRAASDATSGGNITLTTGSAQLTQGSEITSSVFGDPATVGGTVIVNGDSLVLLERSKLTARATQGRGGFIAVNSQVFLYDGASVTEVLDTRSALGNDGTVEVNSPENDISGSITRLPASFLNAAALLSRRCAARDADEASSFIVTGRGGVPRGPKDWAYSSYANSDAAAESRKSRGSVKARVLKRAQIMGDLPVAMIKVSCGR